MNPRRISTHRAIAFVICAGLLLGAFAQSASAQRNIEQRLVARAQQITGDNFPVYTRTRLGVRVYARMQPRTETLRAIDDGLTELFEIARRRGYSRRLNYSDYTIFIARADRSKDSSGAYSPDIAVAAGQYAGSGYDQGGYVYAAGMVMAFNPCVFIIAEHERDLRRVANVVRYEGEHLILYHNDRGLYERTADHSRGGGHPILQ